MNKIIKLINRPFIRNVTLVAAGTGAAQLINMMFSPVITRIYGPEAFGILGVFLSIVGIIGPISALTYPIAIVLPKSNGEAKEIVRLSFIIASIMAILSTLIIFYFSSSIVDLFNLQTIQSFLYLIPLVILFSATLEITQQWLIRTKQFRVTAKATFYNALLLNSAKVGFGWMNPVASVLIILATLGSLLNSLLLIIGFSRINMENEAPSSSKSVSLKKVAKDYKDFPLYRAPQTLLNRISQNLPVLLLSSFFGPASAGFYSLGRSVLSMPIQLIGKSVSNVFYPRITEARSNGESLASLLIKGTASMFTISIIPFGIVIVFGPGLFTFVFGQEWLGAGQYAQWIAIFLLFKFINRPSGVAIPVLELQGKFLIYEVVSTIAKVVALIIGFYFYDSDIVAIALFSIVGVIAYIYVIIWVVIESRKYDKKVM